MSLKARLNQWLRAGGSATGQPFYFHGGRDQVQACVNRHRYIARRCGLELSARLTHSGFEMITTPYVDPDPDA